jgi:putative resolvase
MKLNVWAKTQGLSYRGAYRMWKSGQLPVLTEQLPPGTIIVHPPAAALEGGIAL